ncbi:PhaM family polyhydroxyalkanoate granule multifunctional regulatory protein [Caballeronia sp. DA-9]|uniref:PhaM family polyhydroxyalkanoate granule multifunctional regulatory protein n=1 Tax=Caballeronia sp. DA-9 TaxID=3436237 RepID=UPI003F66AF23
MTDTPGGTPPFGSFPGMSGFPQGDMMEKMWDMMKMNPFASAVAPGGSPSLSMMSDMLAPLTNVEELDKRITDMRAVEQWLKLNLNMLQSAIQALEVQRATLATLRAFGAFAQTSVENAKSSAGASASSSAAWPASSANEARPAADQEAPSEAGANDASFDPAGWWNLLQSQFNNLATLAMAQQPVASDSTSEDNEPPKAAAPKTPRKTAAKKAAPAKTAAKK